MKPMKFLLAALALFVTISCEKTPAEEQEAEILTFTFQGIEGSATIDKDQLTVDAVADETVDLTRIPAQYTLSEGAVAKVGNTVQSSGSFRHDFTEPVIYKVTSGDGKNTLDWMVTITGGTPSSQAQHITSISMPETMYMLPGQTKQINWTVGPDHATNKDVSWASMHTHIADVDQNGLVTATSTPGEATITATAVDEGKHSQSITIIVQDMSGGPQISESAGWLESAYVIWTGVDGADSYNVYYSGNGIVDKKIDTQLVRKYQGDTYRADVLGLSAGSYSIKIVPVFGTEEGTGYAETSMLAVGAHDRSGFAFAAESPNQTASGAYNDDGTLKADAQVIYLTAGTGKTVQLGVMESAGKTTTGTGIGAILKLRQKGYDKTPLAIRIIGTIKPADVDVWGSNNLLEVKSAYNITVEGVGNDATMYNCGVHIRDDNNVEVRNLGFMMHPEDAVSLEVDNQNIWVHNCDFFYGTEGSGDKDKGDGSLDVKTSGFITLSYNHFWDSGKANLLGNGSEPAEKQTYHHNWYDHSDSRHPRVRCHTVHVYNNYYDGVSKYGIGASYGSSIFAENNYFRNTKSPMLTKGQGTDTKDGTFDDPTAGIIKAYGNHLEGVSATSFIPYNSVNAPVEYDAYVAQARNEQVPASIKSKIGGTIYNNFDTGGSMYNYTVDSAQDARTNVMTYAGRTGGKQAADFDWTFNNATDDTDSARNKAMDAALKAYTSKLVSIQGEGSGNGGGEGPGDGDGGGDDGGDDDGGGGGTIGGSVVCHFTGRTNSNPTAFTITGNYSDSKGSVTVNGVTYSDCLKMESATNISFTTSATMTLTLVFGSSETGKKVKVDGTTYTTDGNGYVTVPNLPAGAHAVTKGDSINLFYIALD